MKLSVIVKAESQLHNLLAHLAFNAKASNVNCKLLDLLVLCLSEHKSFRYINSTFCFIVLDCHLSSPWFSLWLFLLIQVIDLFVQPWYFIGLLHTIKGLYISWIWSDLLQTPSNCCYESLQMKRWTLKDWFPEQWFNGRIQDPPGCGLCVTCFVACCHFKCASPFSILGVFITFAFHYVFSG